MNLLQSLLNFLKKKDTPEEETFPEGVCPNCWGREEYGGQFYERVKKENFNPNDKNPTVGWINDYANKHLSGITLKPSETEDELICDGCKVKFKHVD